MNQRVSLCPKMECAAEERLVRMALDERSDVPTRATLVIVQAGQTSLARQSRAGTPVADTLD